MRKIFLFNLLFLICFVAVKSQTVTIGTGTSVQRFPLGNYFGFERSASIYTNTEIGTSGIINKLAWYATVSRTANIPIKIYLKETTSATFAANTWNNLISGATLVYDGTNTSVAANAWNEFNLAPTFTYGGTNNLMVLVEANYGTTGTGSSTGTSVKYTSIANTHQSFQGDNTAPTGNGTVGNSRPNIQITLACACVGTPPSAVFTQECTSNYLSYNVKVNVTSLGSATGVDITDGVTVYQNNVGLGTYTITGLTAAKNIFVQDDASPSCRASQAFVLCDVCSSNPTLPTDECVDAPMIDLSKPFAGSTACSYTVGSSYTSTLSACGHSLDNDSWMKFTAASTEVKLEFKVGDCTQDDGVQLAVFSGNCGALTLIPGSCENPSPTPNENTTKVWNFTGLTVGNEYFVRIDGYAGDECPYWFTPISGVAITPENDSCHKAFNIACGGKDTADILYATADIIPNCAGGGIVHRGLWYKVTGNGSSYTIDTDDALTNFDTEIAVYTGTCAGLTCVGANQNISGANTKSSYTWTTTAGEIYYIFVDGNGAAEGTFVVKLSCVAGTAPTINTNPSDENVCSSTESVSFSISATDATSYQWQIDNSGWSNLSNGGVYSGVLTNTLNISSVSGLIGKQYRCIATNANGSTNSNAASIIGDSEIPVITSTHSDVSINANASCQASLPSYVASVTATDNCGTPTITQLPAAGTTISGLTNTVTLTATDGSGNTATKTFNVAIVDNTNPVITSTHNNQTINANASCQASLPSYVASVTATDNCGTPTITQLPAAGTTISGATNTITLTATDGSGNTATKTFNVAVVDNTNPVITSTHSDLTINANASCQASLPSYVASVTATDNCGAPTITQSPAAGTTISGVTNTVTLTATDGSGNTATKTFNVAVVDNTNPVITSTHSDVSINANASCQASLPSYVASVTATDNCGVPTITQSPAAGITISGATNTVSLTATDGSGNTATKTFNVSVVDNTNPVITSTHNNQTINANASCQASLPSYVASVTATDNCGVPTITQLPAAGTTISGATNTITLTATDGSGNTATKTFNVAIVDNTNPVITSTHNNQTINANTSCQASLPSYVASVTATDNCGAPTITQSPAAGTTISGATNTITLTATDGSGNIATKTFNVAVVDNTNPTITSTHSNQTINANASCQASLPSYVASVTATDNCGTPTITQSPAAGTTISGATNTVTLTATDGSGNIATKTFNVAVVDNTNPVITSTHSDISINANASCQASLPSYVASVTATDNCGAPTITQSPAAGTTISGATNTITLTATDGSGNTATKTFNVAVVDNTAPVANIASLVTITEQCSVNSLTAPTATDNCDGIITATHNKTLPIISSTTITWTYTDSKGNSSTQIQNVVINDNTVPVADVISLPNITSQCSVASLTAPTATDNCSGMVIGTHNVTLPITTQGTTVVTWTYTDAKGNSSTQTQNVIINDDIAPVANISSLSNITAQCAVTTLTQPTATDNCSGIITGVHDKTLPITTQGTTVITWTYTDAKGNSSTQTQNIIINDNIAPVADNSTLPTLTDECAITTLTAPAATDNCSGIVTGTHNVVLPIVNQGFTTVTWTYTDAVGNTSTQNQTVIINDNTAPVASVATLPNIISECAVNGVTPPTAIDNCTGLFTGYTTTTFPITAQGTTVVTWIYKDTEGNTSTQTQNVIIDDNTAPIANIAVLNTLTDECSINSLVAPTATDNCGEIITGTHNEILPITESKTIIWTYIDANGNSSTQTQNIVITDVTPPIPNLTSLPVLVSECPITSLITPTAEDACSGHAVTSHNAIFPITSSTTITWKYTDVSGNFITQNQEVIIDDVTAPVANISNLPDIYDECTVTSLTAATATDNCNGVVYGVHNATLPITCQDTTIVTWTYTDVKGNISTQIQIVIIKDVTAPVANLTNLPIINVECALENITAPTATDNCEGLIYGTSNVVLPISRKCDTIITWTFADSKGNTSKQNQIVSIKDLTAPVASVASLPLLTAECSIDSLISPKAIDNCYGEVIGVSNTSLPITQSKTITWTYTDKEGNKSTQTQSVVINDITAPYPDLVVLPVLNAECSIDTLLSPTATDNCSGKIIGTHNKVLPITNSTTITWTFKDNKGNVKTQTQNVLINDVTAPVASLNTLPVLTDECSITSLIAPKAMDNCKGEIIGKTNSILPITESTVVTWIYTDGNGNSITQTQNVIIEDKTAPIVNNAFLPDIYADCIVSEIDIPTANDNCAGIIAGTANIVLPYKNQGDTTITWTFVDKQGNKSTQNQNIRIEYSDCNDYLEIPTAFSPNNDGVNDVLYAVGRNIASFRMEIYNRYGLKVFETENIKEGWNGQFNGEITEQAVYFYQVYYRTSKKGTITKKGNVTLLK